MEELHEGPGKAQEPALQGSHDGKKSIKRALSFEVLCPQDDDGSRASPMPRAVGQENSFSGPLLPVGAFPSGNKASRGPLAERGTNSPAEAGELRGKSPRARFFSNIPPSFKNLGSKLGLHRRIKTSEQLDKADSKDQEEGSEDPASGDEECSEPRDNAGLHESAVCGKKKADAVDSGLPATSTQKGDTEIKAKKTPMRQTEKAAPCVEDVVTAFLAPFVPLSMKVICDCHVKAASPKEFFDRVIADEAQGFWQEFHRLRGDKDLVCSAWEREDPFNCARRTLSFRHPINYVFAKSVLCHQVQRYKIHPDGHFVMYSEQLMPDLPFGDYFTVAVRWDVKRAESGVCSLCISIEVPFTKKTMLKGRIEQGAFDEGQDTYDFWAQQARAAFESGVCFIAGGQESRGPTIASCLIAISNNENLLPTVRREAQDIVATLGISSASNGAFCTSTTRSWIGTWFGAWGALVGRTSNITQPTSGGVAQSELDADGASMTRQQHGPQGLLSWHVLFAWACVCIQLINLNLLWKLTSSH